MKTYIAVALAIALAFAGSALGTGGSQNTNYTTAGYAAFGIWCKAGGHDYAPIGNPEDYGDTSDPVNKPGSFIGAHESWSFSGEPECLATDVAFGEDDDSALFAAAFCIAGTINGADCGDHRGHDFQISSNDLIGLPNLYISITTCAEDQPDCTTSNAEGEGVSSQGCGTAAVQLPTTIARHWQSPSSAPTYLVWVYIDGAFADETTGNVCVGATGTVTAEF